MNRLLGGWVALALLVGGAGQAAADYVYTTLDVPGAVATHAYGINTAGQVVGDYTDARGVPHGFLLSNGSYITLDAPNSNGTQAWGINNAGQIVGSSSGGFLLSGGSYTRLDLPASFGGQFGPAINVVAAGINDAGQIVGSFAVLTNLNPPRTRTGAFLLSNGVYTNITDPQRDTRAEGINNAGQIVGSTSSQGFLLSGGTYTDLILDTFASGINDAGQISGTYTDATAKDHGFLLSGGLYTFFDVPGSVFTEGFGLNSLGDIVGYYRDAAGRDHGYLAAPIPEPSTLLLLSISMLALIAWAGQRCFLRAGRIADLTQDKPLLEGTN
jgi:probable HAF family extracellular repeat protein